MEFVVESSLSAELMSKHAKLAGYEKKVEKFDEKRFQINLMYIENNFKEAFSKIKLKNNHILFIDGIDIRPDSVPFDDYLDCIKGLANAIWSLNNDFFPTIKDSKGRARVVMLIRPDIFESLGLQNLNTKIRSNSVLLDWVTEYKNYKSSKLFLLIDNLLKSQQDDKTIKNGISWQTYFPYDSRNTQNIKGIEIDEYSSFIQFLRYSYYRPRDIITMLDYLKKNVEPERQTFKKEDFDNRTFLNQYSYYVLGEIKDQLLFYYQLDEYEIFLKFFEFLNGKVSFNYSEYLVIYEQYINYIGTTSKPKPKFTTSANEFLQFLYDLNIICYVEYSKDRQEKFFSWCFKERNYSNLSPKVKGDKEYQIFYSLTKALHLGKEYSDGNFASNNKKFNQDILEQLSDLNLKG